MEDSGVLPGRSDVGAKSFSPFVDRFSLFSLTIVGILFASELSVFFEPIFGDGSFSVVVCGLIISVPLIASSIGKLFVRIRS